MTRERVAAMSCFKVFAGLFSVTLVCCLAVAQTVPVVTQPATSAVPQTTVPPAANATAPATASSADDVGPVQTYHTQINEVNVIFTVLDNNRPPKQVMNFAAETDLPLRVGLLIDASNSIRDRFLFEQQAAIEFLHQIIRPKTDKAFVLAFDEVW